MGRLEPFSDSTGRRLQEAREGAAVCPDHVLQDIASGLRNRPHREAGTAGLAAVGSWAAAFVAAIALVVLAFIWMIRPRQGDSL